MAVEVVFYALAPKPAASGDKTYAAAAAGKVSRGRKWFRLESRPDDVYQFPDNTEPEDVYDWLDCSPAAKMVRENRAAFLIGGEFFTINSIALDSVPNGASARDNAIALYEKGKAGWVVFIPEEAA